MKFSLRFKNVDSKSIFALTVCLCVFTFACGENDKPTESAPETSTHNHLLPNTTAIYQGSEAEALLNSFLLRRARGDYNDSFGGHSRWIDTVTLLTTPSRSISIRSLPSETILSRVIRNQTAGTVDGSQLIAQLMAAVSNYNNSLSAGTMPIVITQDPPISQQTVANPLRAISINETDIELLAQDSSNEDLLDSIDAALSDAARVSIVETQTRDSINPAWTTARVLTAEQALSIDLLRNEIQRRIQVLNATQDNTGNHYYINPAHPGNNDIFVHDSSAEGEAMGDLLVAIREQNETQFITRAVDFATSYPYIGPIAGQTTANTMAKDAFVSAFSTLYVTFNFYTAGEAFQFFHFILRCGHLH